MEYPKQTSENSAPIITVYDRPVKMDECSCTITGANQDIEQDAERFAKSIFIPNWKEELLATTPTAAINAQNLQAFRTTSYHVQAVRKGDIADLRPMSVIGLLHTIEGEIVLGIRGGRMATGKVHFSPAGYVSSRHPDNPLFETILEEMHEELGLTKQQVTSCELIGHETNPVSGGVDFIFVIKTSATREQIDQLHAKAMQAYTDALRKDIAELEARKAILAAGLPNIDAWEHTKLLFIPTEKLQEIVDRGTVLDEGTSVALVDVCKGGMIAYLAKR